MSDEEKMREIFGRLKAVTQEFINAVDAQEGEAVLVDKVLVIYEGVRYDSDGDAVRSINYTTSEDMFSPAATLGLVEAGRALVRQEILGWFEGEQE